MPELKKTGAAATDVSAQPASQAGGSKRADLLIYLALLALTVAVYWPVGGFDFINYDDAEYVAENLRVQMGVTSQNVTWAFQTFYFENWHPLTWLSYMLDYQLFGLNPAAFHLVNMVFHAFNTLLLFAVFKRMTGARWPSAFVGALFALHPLHVESVAWVAERKDVLCAFFGMLTLWAYARYVERPRLGRYFLALLFFAWGLMAKPMLVTLPFVLLLLDFWPLGRVRFGAAQPQPASTPASVWRQSGKNSPQSILRLVAEKTPFFILTALSSIVTYSAQQGARVTIASLPVTQRIANALVSYGRYVLNTLWPTDLAVFYPHPGHWPAWQVGGAGLLLAAVTLFAFRRWRNSPYLTVGWLWYLGMLVPVIGLVQVGEQAMADRYMYVPMIGLVVMLAWGVADVAERWRIKKAAVVLSGGAVVLGCLVLSGFQVRLWKNSLTLFRHALAVTTGNTVAHNSLGDALLSEGKTNEAVAEFSAVLALDPEDALAHGNMGNVLLGQGKGEEALAQYQQGLRFNPKNPELNYNTGICLAKLGRFSEAVPYYSAALQLRAEYADAYLNLGNALAGLGRFDEAIANYTTALRLRPNFAPAHLNIGNALTQQGKHAEAAPHYAESLRLEPTNAQAHCNLALSLAGQGKTREAVAHLTEALRLRPEDAQFHFHLATVLAGEKKAQEAIAQYHEALRLKPDSTLALNNLAWILATQEDANLRNGAEAVKCAERACELTGRQQAFLMGTLAAAYAEAGRFPEAVSTAQKAVELATAGGQKEIAARNQNLLELYRAGKPYHEGKAPP